MDYVSNEIDLRMKICAERLARLREENDLSMEEMGNRIGSSRTSISRYESGERVPELRTLVNVASEFGVSLEWLTGGDVAPNASALQNYFKELSAEGKNSLMQYATFLYEGERRKRDGNKK